MNCVKCEPNSVITVEWFVYIFRALLNEITEHYKNPSTKPYPKDDNPLLLEVSTYLDWAGIGNPYARCV